MASPSTGHGELGETACEDAAPPTRWPSFMNRGYRACFECRRKKTKCDMQQPICGLCYRTGGSCTFPTKRKTPEQRRGTNMLDNKKRKIDPERLERLVDLLESRLTSDSVSDQISPPNLNSEDRVSTTTIQSKNDDDLDLPTPTIPTTSKSSHEVSSGDDSFLNFSHCSRGSPDDLRYNGGSLETCQTSTTSRDRNISSILHVPEELATELITIFFVRIQAWLPLLHKPKFFAEHMTNPEAQFCRQDEYSILQAFQLYGIFALAARFSNSTFFEGIPPPERGSRFGALAEQCYQTLRGGEAELTLAYLQGCILLAFYLHTSGPTHKGWVLTGVCVRFVYELDLYNMDQEDEMGGYEIEEAWVDLEEHRRAFWLVWELDAFSAIMSRRPHAIDRQSMAVKLPVSDAAWFANKPVESPLLDPRPAEAWKVLLNSPNQDARAWFLLSNYILAVCNDTCSSRYTSSQDQDDLVNAVTCIVLAITQRFGLEKHPLVFDSANFAKSNWVIGMHLMLLAARSFVSTLGGGGGATRAAGTLTSSREVGNLIFHWHPNYVESSHPFFVCSLLPTCVKPSRELLQPPSGGSQTHQDMLMLILSGHAAVWKLGSILLHILDILTHRTQLVEEDAQLVKYFAIYFPQAGPSARRRRSTANASPPTIETKGSDKGVFSDKISNNVPSFEQVFEIPDTPLDYANMEHGQMDPLIAGVSGKPYVSLNYQYNIDQGLQLELDRLSDDYQPFSYLAF